MAIDFKYKGEQTKRKEIADLDKLKKIFLGYLPNATTKLNGLVYVVFEDSSCIAFRSNGEVVWTTLENGRYEGIASEAVNHCLPDRHQGRNKVSFSTYDELKDFVLEFTPKAIRVLQEPDD